MLCLRQEDAGREMVRMKVRNSDGDGVVMVNVVYGGVQGR